MGSPLLDSSVWNVGRRDVDDGDVEDGHDGAENDDAGHLEDLGGDAVVVGCDVNGC